MSALVTLGAQAPGLPLDANPISQPVGWLVKGVQDYIRNLYPGKAFAGIVTAIVPTLGNGEDANKAINATAVVRLTLCGPSGQSLGCKVQSVGGALRQVGKVLLGVVLLARLVRLGARGEFRSPQHVVFDLFPRIVGGLVAMEWAGTTLTAAIRLAALAAMVLDDVVLRIAGGGDPGRVMNRLPGVADGLISTGALLYLTVGLLFVLVLVVEIGITLLGVLAPILIPFVLQGEPGGIGTAWFRALTSCLLILVLAPVGTAASIALLLVLGRSGLPGAVSGALVCEAGLLATSIACFTLARIGFAQTRDSFRLTLAGAGLGAIGDLPGQMVDDLRAGIERGARVGIGVAQIAGGVPAGAVEAGAEMTASRRTPPQAPEPEPPSSEGAALPAAGDEAESPGDRQTPPDPETVMPGREGAGLSSASFLAYCAVQVRVDGVRGGRPAGLIGLLEGRGGHPKVSIEEVQHLYAQYLAEPPDSDGRTTRAAA